MQPIKEVVSFFFFSSVDVVFRHIAGNWRTTWYKDFTPTQEGDVER